MTTLSNILKRQPIVLVAETEIIYSHARKIVWIEADGAFSLVKLTDRAEPLVVFRMIGVFEAMNSEQPFLRQAHHLFIVNSLEVETTIYEEETLLMSDGRTIPFTMLWAEEMAGLSMNF